MEKNGIATAVIKRIEDLAVPLRAFGDKAWGVLSFNPAADLVAPPKCISFSVEPGCIRAVYGARYFSRFRVHECKTYAAVTKDYPAADEVASLTSVAVAEMHAERAEIVLIIPKAWVLVRSAMLPAAAAENLPQVLSFEFDRLTPFSADEAAFDFLERPADADGIPVTVAAAKISVVMDYVSALAEKGLVVSRVGIDVSAISTLIRFVTASDSFSFVSLAETGIRGGLSETGILQSGFDQKIEAGASSVAAAVVQERGLHVALSGASPAETPRYALADPATAHLKHGLAADSGHAWHAVESPAVRIEGVESFETGYETAVGGLLEHFWPGAHGFNLLSRGVRRKVRPPFLLTALLAAAVLICIGIYVFMPLQVEEQRLKEIERQISLRKDEVRSVEKLKKEIEDITREISLVDNFRKEKPLYIDVAREITQLIPKNAWLTRIRIAGVQVNLEGYSPSASSLLEVLEASRFFQKVEFASPTFRDARLNADRFQIKMELEGIQPEKPLEKPTNEKK